MSPLFGDISNIISLAITPAFLLLGVMMLLRVLNNRLARIIDRCRTLESRINSQIGTEAEQLHALAVLFRRMRAIHHAIGCSIVCVMLICSVVVSLFVDDVLNLRLDMLIALLFALAMLLLIASFSLFLHEILIATHTLPSTALYHPRQAADRI
jgi:hypothetical protein